MELADKHWEYIKDLLVAHKESQDRIDMIEFHYKSAFIHGFKHGVEGNG